VDWANASGLGLAPRIFITACPHREARPDLANARGFPGIFSLSLTAEFLAQNYSYTLADRGVHGSWSDCIRREIFPSPKKSVIKITDAREIFFDFILHL
jgi:hypothetical protein